MAYTVADARRECKELFDEGYGFSGVRIFLHDLARSKDITWDDVREIMHEIIEGRFGQQDCGIGTF